jgi:hypothetical protein
VTEVGRSEDWFSEPGLDLHEWESAWTAVAEEASDDPDAAVSQFADLVHRMLLARGYAVDDPVAREGDEPEMIRSYLSVRETAERAELGEASRGDVEAAIDDLRSIFDTLVAEQP